MRCAHTFSPYTLDTRDAIAHSAHTTKTEFPYDNSALEVAKARPPALAYPNTRAAPVWPFKTNIKLRFENVILNCCTSDETQRGCRALYSTVNGMAATEAGTRNGEDVRCAKEVASLV